MMFIAVTVMSFVILELVVVVFIIYLIHGIQYRSDERSRRYCRKLCWDLENAKTDDWFNCMRELGINDIIDKYNLNPDEWIFNTVIFENIYDSKPTKMQFSNIHTGQVKLFDMWEDK